MARKLKKEDIKKKMLLDYIKSNEKYSKLLKEIELGKTITYEHASLKYRSRIPRGYKASRGEVLIEKLLIKANIYFLKEVEFKGCNNPKTGKKLRFDFYLPEKNKCIEFDGIQHFESVLEFDGKDNGEALKQREKLDNIKNNFCKSNKIDILRIKYNEDDKISKINKFIK